MMIVMMILMFLCNAKARIIIIIFLPLISTPSSLLFYLLVFKLLYLMLFLLILTVSDYDIATAHMYLHS